MKSVKNYVFTERAHYMCPNMHFGIMAKIERMSVKSSDLSKGK